MATLLFNVVAACPPLTLCVLLFLPTVGSRVLSLKLHTQSLDMVSVLLQHHLWAWPSLYKRNIWKHWSRLSNDQAMLFVCMQSAREACCWGSVCVCVRAVGGGMEERKHQDGSCQLPLPEMTETGAVKSPLYTRTLSVSHTHTQSWTQWHMPAPTQHAQSACQHIIFLLYFLAWETVASTISVSPGVSFMQLSHCL